MPKRLVSRHASRRGLAAAGALSLSVAGGAFVIAGADSASAASATGQYKCSVPDFGLTFNTPWTVALTADIPTQVEPGATIPAPAITANVTSGADAADLLRTTGNKTITAGTAVANYSVGAQARTANLTVAGTPITIPTSGGIKTVASGSGQAETAPSTNTTIPVSAGDFTANLTTDTGFVAKISCTPIGGPIALGSIKVAAKSSPTSTPTSTPSSTSTPSPTSTPTATPTSGTASGTSTSSTSPSRPATVPAGSSTSSPSKSGTPAAGPKVQTDMVAQKHSLNVLGAGFAVAGAAALGGAAVMGRRHRS